MIASRMVEAVDEQRDPALAEQLFRDTTLDPESRLPLYAQLDHMVRSRICQGVLHPGDRLPTEKALQRYFHVSRITVRQALEGLVRDGLIHRRRGRGTEVNPPRVEISIDGADRRGPGFRDELLAEHELVATEAVSRALGVPPGTLIQTCERRLLMDEERVAHLRTYAPAGSGGVAPGAPRKVEEVWDAAQADRSLAALLGVPVGAPLLRRERRAHVESGHWIESLVGHYRGDRFRYRFPRLE